MTDLTVQQSETTTFQVTVTDEASPPVAIDVTNRILKFKAFKRYNALAPLILKTSYDSTEIEKTDPANGIFKVYLDQQDTQGLAGYYRWMIEVYEKLGSASTTGTLDVTNGSNILSGTGLALDEIKDGDILVLTSGEAANTKDITIFKQVDADGVETGDLESDYYDWTTETGLSFTIYRSSKKIPTSLCGEFTIEVC